MDNGWLMVEVTVGALLMRAPKYDARLLTQVEVLTCPSAAAAEAAASGSGGSAESQVRAQ